MTVSVLRLPADTWNEQAAPARTHGSAGTMYLTNLANAVRYGYMSFAGLPPANASIFSATLSVKLAGAWTGQTISVRRLSERWSESALNWQNKPASVATHAVTTAPITGNAGDEVLIDVTTLVRDMLAAGQRFGFRLESNSTLAAGRALYASEAGAAARRPTLSVDWTTAPTVATDLWPGGGDAVSVAAPWVGWTYRDLQGDQQQSFRVQVSTDTSFTGGALLFDSGVVASADPQADLAALGWAGLAVNASAYWRVQVVDAYGTTSPWSDPSYFTRKAKGTLVINAPGATVDSDSPTVVHTFTPPAGAVQQSVRYVVEERQTDGTTYVRVYDSGRRVTTATSYELPAGAIRRDGYTYRLTVTVWDNVDRATTPGDLPSVSAQMTFVYSPAAGGPTAPTNVVATQEAGGGPGVVLTWSRAAIPDAWTVLCDGVIVASRLDALSLSTGGTNYAWTYYGADGWLQHDFRVLAAVQNAGVWAYSPKPPPAFVTPLTTGVWLVDDAVAPVVRVQLLGHDVPDLSLGESSEVYRPVGRSDPVIVRDAMRGLEGAQIGVVATPADYDAVAAMVANSRIVRYAFGRLNVPVRIRSLTYDALPLDSGYTGVSVEVYQVAEFSP